MWRAHFELASNRYGSPFTVDGRKTLSRRMACVNRCKRILSTRRMQPSPPNSGNTKYLRAVRCTRCMGSGHKSGLTQHRIRFKTKVLAHGRLGAETAALQQQQQQYVVALGAQQFGT